MSDPISVGSRQIGPGPPCFIAAEIGINHNGDIALAHRGIDAAADAGADGVKFQNYATTDFLSDESLQYTYESQGRVVTESQYAMFTRCALPRHALAELKAHCDERGVVFFSTPTSIAGVADLMAVGAPLLKNGSDFLTHIDVIRAMAATRRPTILSTGMATVAEIDEAVTTFRKAGGGELVLLHCTSSYPTPPRDVNLRRIPVLARMFGCLAGFSDHTEGTVAAVAAVVLGACFIEKHFTLDRQLPGPDHRFSSDPAEFAALVKAIRATEIHLGDEAVGPTESERVGRIQFRLSCVAVSDLQLGTRLEREHIAFRRPGAGIAPTFRDSLVGLTLMRAVAAGQPLQWADFKHG